MAPPRCQFLNCTNTSRTHSLFRFPTSDENRLRIWINNSGNITLTTLTPDQLKKRHLCEVHFEPFYKSQNDKQPRLTGTAIPRHYRCEDKSIDIISSVPVECPMQGTRTVETPETSPKTLKVLTPKKMYGKRACPFLDLQEAGSSSASSQFGHEYNMPSPQKRKNSDICLQKKCVEKKRQLHATKMILKNKKVQIKRLKKKLLPENILHEQKFRSKSSRLMATMQLRRKKHKWTKEERQFSLAIFYKSPATYNFLRHQGVILPAVSSIKRWLSEAACLPGVERTTFDQIKYKFQTSSYKEKACMLTFDEMSIMTCLEYNKKFDFIEGYEDLGKGERTQKVAKHVLVFLARGIYSNWKLPLCYFLSNTNVKAEKLQTLIRVVINKLFDAGLLPKVTVCDQVTTNQSALKGLGASKHNPFFFVNERKLFAVFDVPHCIKNLRNNWLQNNYTYKNKEVSFSDVISTYEIDRDNKSRALLKITPNHLCPNSFQKMKVKLATQIFSHSVGAAITTAIKTKELISSTAANTAELIFIVNDLFDALNSKTKFDRNPNKCGLTSDNAARQAVVRGLEVLQDLKKINIKGSQKKTTIPPCFEGLQQSCNAITKLFEEEHTDGIEYLLTNRLNQDVLENLFSIYRLKGGNNKNPSARVLRSVFRSYLTEMLVRLPGHQNCEEQMDCLTCEIPGDVGRCGKNPERECHTSPQQGSSQPTSPQPTSPQPTSPQPSTSSQLAERSRSSSRVDTALADDISRSASADANLEQCSVTYFAGWLAKKCHEKYNCKRCLKAMTQNANLHDRKQLLILEKTYGNSENTKLICPSQTFYQIIDACLTNYERHFDMIKHKLNIKKNILNNVTCELKTEHANALKMYCTEHINYVLEKCIITKINFFCKSQKRNLIQHHQKIRLLQNK